MDYNDLDENYFDENGEFIGGYFSDSEQRNYASKVQALMQYHNPQDYWLSLDGKVTEISKLSDKHLSSIPAHLHSQNRGIPKSIWQEIGRRGFTLNEDYSVSGYDKWRPKIK